MKMFIQSNVIQDQVIKHIQTVPNYQNLKYNMQLVHYICQLIEDTIDKGNSKKKQNKIDKKQLVTTILQQLFQLNPNEIQMIEGVIECFVTNNFVKKKTKLKKLFTCLVDKLPTLPK
jgi:hypothetical protein